MKHTKNTIVKETAESRELGLYADNDSEIYFAYIVPVVKNLAKYYKRGNFDRTKAIDAFFPAATAAAKKYCREFARVEDAPKIFDVTARYTAAAYLLECHMENIENGDL
jgi:hypothetical protein